MPKIETVETSSAPKALGPYSQAVRLGSWIFLSGQIGIDPQTGGMVSGEVVPQARQVFANIRAVLNEAGADFSNVVSVRVYLLNMKEFSALNEVYKEYFSPPYPARAAIGVHELPAGAEVEIEVVASL